MKYILIACSSLFLYCLGQAQTTDLPAEAAKHQIRSQQCSDCSIEIAPVVKQPTAGESVLNTGLPDSPSFVSSEMPNAFVWDLTVPSNKLAAPPRRDPIWDKKMWAAHLFLAGSMIFDVEATHQGIAHHMCVEGNSELTQQPSRGELYLDDLEQFAPIVVLDGLTALAGRSAHLPRWAWKPLGYIGPIYGSTIHLRGGSRWFTQCW